ncbi:MAG TPA: hypothetical protein DIW80_07240 [Gordonia polyisoprenivorans]|nr:hypothetical protein [Gordonia polyisoprenivorans]
MIDLRSANSRTFAHSDGALTTEFYSAPIFYQPAGVTTWQPIDVGFRAVTGADAKARSDKAPTAVALHAADAPDGFMTLEGGGHTIRFRLAPGTAPGRAGAQAVIKEDGRFADYTDFLPGGIGLRVFPRADGAKTFLVLPSRPLVNTFTFAVSAPGLSLAAEPDGSLAFRDGAGNVVGRIPRPFMVDSSDVEGRGGGLYSEAVTLTLGTTGAFSLVTLIVDPAFLDSAVYPVYLDPTTTSFPTGTTTANDTFASAKYPNSNFVSYQRPDAPGYHEMWHGKEPGTTYYNEIYIRFNSIIETLGSKVHIDDASLQVFPYWQYYHSGGRPSWVRRISQDWAASTLTWNDGRPATDQDLGQHDTTEGQTSDIDLTAHVQDVVNGTPNHGVMVHANTTGQGNWKRIVSLNEADSPNLKPKLVVKWHRPSATPSSPTGNAWGNRTLSWTYSNGDAEFGTPQSDFEVEVDSDNTFGTPDTADSGWVASSATSWTFSGGSHGATYWWRVRVKDGFGESSWSSPAQFRLDTQAPTVDFTNPNEGTTTPQSATTYSVAWSEADAGSGPASRSLQRQRGQIVTPGTCAGVVFGDDGVPNTAASPAGYIAGAEYQTWWAVSSHTVPMPAAIQAGDQLIAFVIVGREGRTTNPGQTTVTPPAGWSQIERRDYLSDVVGYGSEYLIYQKVATAADAGGQVWSVSPDRGFAVNIVAYRGLRFESITAPVTRSDSQTPATEITLPNVTLAAGQYALQVVGSVYWQGDWFVSVPTGWTERFPMGALHYQQHGFLERFAATAATLTGPTVANNTTHGAHRRLAWGVVLTPHLAPPQPVNEPILASGFCYRWRQTLTDVAGNSAQFTSGSVLVDVSLENGGRGEESYYTRVPFDLGGGWRMAVGVHNGELTLDRHLFEIPSYGPAQSLSLSYSSKNTTTTGYFGNGWSSNLTQSLSFDTNLVRWHRADGGMVHFTLVGSTWTPTAGHFETLVHDSANGRYVLTEKDQTRLIFENAAPGRLLRVENRFGKALVMNWGTSSATATDASGRATTLAITSGRITSATDSAGRSWTFGYTGNDLTTVTDPANKTTTLGYAASHVIMVTRSRSRASGSPESIIWSVAYSGGKVTGVTDPVDATVANTFSYGTNTTTVGLLKEYSPLVRNTWTHTLDALGRVTSTLDPEGYTTSYAYDAQSNLTQLVLPIEIGPPAVNQTIAYTFDARGNVLTETRQLTATTNVVTVMTYNGTNDLLTRSEGDNDATVKLVTRHTYDAAGHLTSANVNCTSSGTTPPASAGTCTGAGTQDSGTNLITTFSYTANDQLETETDPLGRVTKHAYDLHGNETSTVQNFVSGQSATADRNVTTTVAFDQTSTAGKAGLVTSTTDPVGNTISFGYDVIGRQTSESLPGDASIPALTGTTTYDELGNVLTETVAWTGVTRTTTHVYDKANRETILTDPAGVQSITSYDAAGNAVSTTSAGVTTTRAYDGLGHPVCERQGSGSCPDTGGPEMTQEYDGQGRPTRTVDGEGVTTTRTYDLGGRLKGEVVESVAGNLATTYSYDLLDRQTSTTPPDATTTMASYDRVGRVVCTRYGAGDCPDSLGLETRFGYDRLGNQISVTDRDGTVTTTVHDPLDRPTRVVANDVPGTPGPGEDITTETYFDAVGNTLATKDADGNVNRKYYSVRGTLTRSISNCTNTGIDPPADPAQCAGTGTRNSVYNVVTTLAFDGSGSEQAVMDPRGTVTRSFYNAAGQSTKTIVNCTNDTTNPSPPSSDWWNCNGSTLSDGTWNVASTRTYYNDGNLEKETAPNGRVTKYVYDASGRVSQRIDNWVVGSPAPSENISTYFAYDAAGRQSAVRAPTADRSTFSVTRYLYDDAGRLVTEIRNCTDSGETPPGDPVWTTCQGYGTKNADTNLIAQFGYDSSGNRASVTTADPSASSGTEQASVTTRYAYDGQNRLCGVLENATVPLASPNPCALPGSGSASANVWTTYTYDAVGNLSTMVDGRGNTTTYGYDEFGRTTFITDALLMTTTYGYDDLGRRASQSERGVGTMPTLVSWTYDDAGRVLTRSWNNSISHVTSYEYDANGNRTRARNQDGSTISSEITATYDRLNRPLTVAVVGDSGAATTYTYNLTSPSWTDPSGQYTATLDKFDRQILLTDPIHGTPWAWTYRADGRPGTWSAPNGNTTTYGYDDVGAASTKVTAAGQTQRASYTWTRNRAGQILTEASTITGDPTNGTTTYAYDALAHLTSYSRGSSTTTFGWQAVPNRSTVQVDANPALTTSFDDANRPTSDSAGGSYSNDADGRLTARPGQILEWDDLGRLTAVKSASTQAVVAAYTYDALDRLFVVTPQSGGAYRFRYVGLTTQIAQTADQATSDPIWKFANDWSGGRLVDWTGTGAEQHFYGANGHHDITWTATDSGSVDATLRYDPWGNLMASTGTHLPNFRYHGSWFDSTVALAWVVTRWYSSALGRFISEDTLLGDPAEPAGRHLYAYGAGEPIGRWDPDGRAARSDLYGSAKSAHKFISFTDHQKMVGKVRMAFFIRDSKVCLTIVFLDLACGKGDDRGYSSGGDCLRSRVCVTIDWDHNYVFVVANPSCGTAPGDCTDAYPIRTTTSNTNFLAGGNNDFALNDNKVSLWATGGGKSCPTAYSVTLPITGSIRGTHFATAWSWKQSYLKLPLPTIDGGLDLMRCGTRARWRVQGDGYPMFEMYYYRAGALRWWLRKDQGGIVDLAPIFGDWSSEFWTGL